MIVLFVLSMVLFSFSILFFDNSWLMWNSTFLYSFQFLVFSLILLKKIKYFHSLFLPSNMLFFYLGLSFAIGSAVVPHNIGFLTADFIDSYREVTNFPFITFFWINIFNLVFYISYRHLDKFESSHYSLLVSCKSSPIKIVILLFLLLAVSVVDIFFKFGFQLAIIAFIISRLMESSFLSKFIFVSCVMLIMVVFNAHNKREVLIAIMLVVFIFSIYHRYRFEVFSFNSIYYFLGLSFVFSVVVAASIIRGYGNFILESPLHAFLMIPDYFKLEGFYHIIVDNFEFSHTFPAAILSVEYAFNGKIDLQAGLTLIKPLFIVIPREIWSLKPDSYIAIFTSFQAPNIHNVGGSFPVALPSELFANFHLFSILIFSGILLFFNSIFHQVVNCKGLNFLFICFVGIIVLFFMLVRGSGFDLFLIHSLPLVSMALLLNIKNNLKIKL